MAKVSGTHKLELPLQPITDKLKDVPGLIFSTILAILLLVQRSTQSNTSEQFVRAVSSNTATTALTVQILSHLFGSIHLSTIRKYIDPLGQQLCTETAQAPLSDWLSAHILPETHSHLIR